MTKLALTSYQRYTKYSIFQVDVKTLSERTIIIRQLGITPYQQVSDAMHQFTGCRTPETCDEIWLVEHPRVFTQGQAGKAEHVLAPGDIPVIQSDRGGQVTYHGPGQQIMYVMLDLKRNKIGVRELVTALENTVVNTLAHFNIAAYPRPDAPGVYVNGDKICSLGLRIRQGCSFHGLALNIDMDLEPFNRINPCGYSELKMTQVSDLAPKVSLSDVQPVLIRQFCDTLGFHIVQ
ncbi:lipoyl(octanoyl) transferase LipB [Providencia rettgeri]|nr:lipoyl(octanoyl) transferase LipB [Providencia rettgeri]MBQ0366374.1 lipoyl(octanoyl) transferase LipB [Providencia rettgeri]